MSVRACQGEFWIGAFSQAARKNRFIPTQIPGHKTPAVLQNKARMLDGINLFEKTTLVVQRSCFVELLFNGRNFLVDLFNVSDFFRELIMMGEIFLGHGSGEFS